MNPLESQLGYPFADAVPETGSVLEIMPGLSWARMRLPFALDHVNVWPLKEALETPYGRTDG